VVYNTSMSNDTLSLSLKHFFGYDTFRPFQREAMLARLEGKDLLVIMPTGGGKSLCYQLPALLSEGVTVIISPLLALIHDQVTALKAMGIPAAAMTSMESRETLEEIRDGVYHGEIKLLYVSPERMSMEGFITWLCKRNVSGIVIDEAHCISEWGHDFRPDYRALSTLKEHFPNASLSAFTATATPHVARDIISTLELHEPHHFIGSFMRHNLILNVQKRRGNGRKQLIDFLKNYSNESGIIYTFTRKETETLSLFLQESGIDASAYHGGLEHEVRTAVQNAFIRDEVKIVVATVAFGMGIDKSNVRFVVHMDLPKSPENYFQEVGRAGRDGLLSECLLLYSWSDVERKKLLLQDLPISRQEIGIRHLETMHRFAASALCRHRGLAGYFGERVQEDCKERCDNCKHPKEEIDVTQEAQKFLSTVYRTEERFGRGYLIDVLRGSKGARIKELKHDRLSVYGIGHEYGKEVWEHLSEHLLELGALERGEFSALKLTAIGVAILRGSYEVKIDKALLEHSKHEPKRTALSQEQGGVLFEYLRQKRLEIAKDEGIPAYMVFSDATLKEMERYQPLDETAFLQLNGVGKRKLEKYAEAFMVVIAAYQREDE